MYKGIIFDLDQTLVDSKIAEQFRRERNWSKVYSLIPSFILYDGLNDVFKYIRSNGIKVCIVTTSPGTYVNKVISHFNIPCDAVVDYFSVKPIKPHPNQMYKALELLDLKNQEVLSFGDRGADIISSNSASIKSVGCTWGSQEIENLKSSKPDYIISEPKFILNLI